MQWSVTLFAFNIFTYHLVNWLVKYICPRRDISWPVSVAGMPSQYSRLLLPEPHANWMEQYMALEGKDLSRWRRDMELDVMENDVIKCTFIIYKPLYIEISF